MFIARSDSTSLCLIISFLSIIFLTKGFLISLRRGWSAGINTNDRKLFSLCNILHVMRTFDSRSGTVMGLSNGFGNIAGIIVPLVKEKLVGSPATCVDLIHRWGKHLEHISKHNIFVLDGELCLPYLLLFTGWWPSSSSCLGVGRCRTLTRRSTRRNIVFFINIFC